MIENFLDKHKRTLRVGGGWLLIGLVLGHFFGLWIFKSFFGMGS